MAAPIRELLRGEADVDDGTHLRRFTGFSSGALLDRLVVDAAGRAAPALLMLYPAVHAAWADGEADEEERRRICQAAWELELDTDARGWALLETWLREPPPLGAAVLLQQYVSEAVQTWSAHRYERWRVTVLALAAEVAEASGGGWFSRAVSAPEAAWLESLAASLDALNS